MFVVLDPPVPADQSLVWRIHDGYFRHRGIRAWTAGEVPWYATSNLPAAQQHAAFLLRVVPPDGPIHVLEIGSGLGQFAARFLSALRNHLGDEGRALAARLTWYLSDFSEKSLREAIATPAVAREVDAGRMLPVVFDVREPGRASDLDGLPVHLEPLSLVVGNYVACVLASKSVQWRGVGGWFEQYLAVKVEVDPSLPERPLSQLRDELLADPTRSALVSDGLQLDVSWVRTELDAIVPDPVHQRALRDLVDGRGDTTVSFPTGFAVFCAGMASRLSPWGYVLCNDYGSVDRQDLDGLDDRRPQVYGNSLAHGVAFPALAAWAKAAGWDALCTSDPLESVHSGVVRPLPFDDGERRAWQVLDDGEASDEIVDASTVAKRFADQGSPDRALRFYRRCLELEPDNVEHLHRAGQVAIDAGRYELAVELLTRGRDLNPDSGWDFEFQLGRATCLLEDWPTSRAWYELATTREDHQVTWTNLGIVLEEVGDSAGALRCYEEAQRVSPGDPRSQERLEGLRDRFWAEERRRLAGERTIG